MAITKRLVEFQDYELTLILEGLKLLKEKSGRKWEQQPDGQYGYTDNRASKQIRFIENSIKRQTEK